MDFSLKIDQPERLETEMLIIGVREDALSRTAERIDEVTGRLISSLIKTGEFRPKLGKTCLLRALPDIAAKRLVLVGLGDKPLTSQSFSLAISAAISATLETAADNAVLALTDEEVIEQNINGKAKLAVMAAYHACYRFDELKEKQEAIALTSIGILACSENHHDALGKALQEGFAIAEGAKIAKRLGNLPGNICNPSFLAEIAKEVSKESGLIKTTVYDERDLEKMGLGSFVSVSKGSSQSGKMIVMKYSGGQKDDAPIVLIGKGITFDSGGISLKPGPSMDEMKFDMCGAASVIGAIKAAALLKLPLNIISIVGAAENMPNGNANKPGDIVTSLSGKTIEVLNTDAEGRLILCDCLTFAEREFKPRLMIDIATLTGACVIALGKHPSGLFTKNDELAGQILAAGEETGDRAWRMPLWDDYQEQLKSNFADVANIGGREAGSVTAACFLDRFVENTPWAHLDIAGTAWESGSKKGATGRPVALLTQFLINQC